MTRRCGIVLLMSLTMLGCQGTGELGGTSWNVVEVISTSEPEVGDMDVAFGTDGWITSTITSDDGSTEEHRNKYSVYRTLLVVERDQGDLEVLHQFNDDGELILTDENFQARLRRTN